MIPSAAIVAAAVALAGAGDPLQAPECRQALAALQTKEDEASAASASDARRLPRAIDVRLAAAQRRAARSCLASRADPPAPSRLASPPLAVPPVAGARPPLPAASPVPAVPPQPPGAPPLTSITSCDAAGCWASDGARLHRVGPTLWGPRGPCSVQGTVVLCP
ncbi:MAG: hypothetical protein ACXWUL_02305 [Caldimonas sp.]